MEPEILKPIYLIGSTLLSSALPAPSQKMSLTLPIEAMSHLQVSFKVLLPDGRFSFDMAPNLTPCSPRVSDLKLHFEGAHDETGGVTFTVWLSGLETESDSDDKVAPDNPVMYTPSPSRTWSFNSAWSRTNFR